MGAEKTFKMTTLVGESDESIEAAVRTALRTSASHVRGGTWARVADLRANLSESGDVERWQATVEIAFLVED